MNADESSSQPRTYSRLRTIGRTLLLCFPASLLVGGVYFCFAPRLYRGQCVLDHQGGYEALYPAFVIEARPYRDDDPRMLQWRSTSLCSVELYDPDSQRAAQKANQLGERIRGRLDRELVGPLSPEGFLPRHSLRIWQRAEPEKAPARPDAVDVTIRAIAAGLGFALLGTLLLLGRYFLIRRRQLRADGLPR